MTRDLDVNGALVRHYTYGDQPLTAHGVTGVAAYIRTDRLGSVRAMTDSTGTVTSAGAWELYGRPRAAGPNNPNAPPLGWLGRYQDPTGLTHLRARHRVFSEMAVDVTADGGARDVQIDDEPGRVLTSWARGMSLPIFKVPGAEGRASGLLRLFIYEEAEHTSGAVCDLRLPGVGRPRVAVSDLLDGDEWHVLQHLQVKRLRTSSAIDRNRDHPVRSVKPAAWSTKRTRTHPGIPLSAAP